MISAVMDLSLKNGCKSTTTSDCQKSKRRGAINKTNGNGTTPTRNLLRRVINNLSNSQASAAIETKAAAAAQFPSQAAQALPNSIEVTATKATTKHRNFSNHISKNQIKIDDDDDEFGNNKKNEAELYSYATANSINYEPLHVRQSNASKQCTNNKANGARHPPAPMGHAPKTLPILQALNELNLVVDVNVQDDNYEEEFPIIENSKLKSSSSLRPNNVVQASPSRLVSTPPEPAPRPSLGSATTRQSESRAEESFGSASASSLASSARSSPQKPVDAMPGTRRYLKNSKASNSPRRSLPSTANHHSRTSLTFSPSSPAKLVQKTPAWIVKIFQFTKSGRLDLLQGAVYGLDSTLIRHLVDGKGNNLLHCSARKGHIHILEWLVSILGDQFEAALNDQNSNRNNVILTALKNTQLGCLRWLVINSITGSNALTAKDGKKSLLHYAAKYNLVDAVGLLCEFHVQYQITLDIQDSSFCTPLHTAAKFGNICVAQVLIQFGADPLCQTELGCKPSDLAARHHRSECCAYFRMVEAGACLGTDLHSSLTQVDRLQTQCETLQTHFRELLRVSKCLAKERNELIKHFPFVGSKSFREETATAAAASSAQTATAAKALLLSSNGVSFSDLEHKLAQAEHVWKQIETRESSFLRRPDEPLNNDHGNANFAKQPPYILQKYLAGAEAVTRARHSTGSNVHDLPSSTSEEDSSNNEQSSDDEDVCFDEERAYEPTYHNIAQFHLNKTKSCSNLPTTGSANTPWLLPATETSILSSMSPVRVMKSPRLAMPSLELRSSPNFLCNHSGKNSSFNSSSSIAASPVTPKSHRIHLRSPSSVENGNEEIEDSAAVAVIEVIEPGCTKLKRSSINSKPMQTPVAATMSTPPDIFANNEKGGRDGHLQKVSGVWISSEQNNSLAVETESGAAARCSSVDYEICSPQNTEKHANLQTEEMDIHLSSEAPLLSPKPKRRPRRREVGSYGDSFSVTDSKSEPIAQSNQCHINAMEDTVTVMSVHTDTGTSTSCHVGLQYQVHDKGESFVKVPVPQLRSLHSITPRNDQHQRSFGTRLTTFPGPEIRFPVSYPNLLGRPTDNSGVASSSITQATTTEFNSFEAAASSNSKVQALTHPSVSDCLNSESSSAWPAVELPQCSPPEFARSLSGHQSPSPSETESALAPPPSQVSQSSDVSKTESVRGQQRIILPTDAASEETRRPGNSNGIINYCHIVTGSAPPPTKSVAHDSELLKMMSGSRRGVGELVDRDKGSCDNQPQTDDKIDNNETRGESMEECVAVGQSSITQPVKTTHSTPTASFKSIHGSNNGHEDEEKHEQVKLQNGQQQQQQPKPWYEVEMSDDEDEILLRVARARAEASNDSSNSSKPNSDEDDELHRQSGGQHQCGLGSTSCSQYNCPNFV